MAEKKKPAASLHEEIKELNDAQLSQVIGGLAVPVIPSNGKSTGLKLGQALDLPSCFTKSGDSFPSNNGF